MGHASEFSRRTKWAKVGHQKVNSLEKRASRRTTWPLSGLEHPFRLNFSRTGLFSLKTTIYATPGGFRRGYGRVDQNHRNRESAGRCQRRSATSPALTAGRVGPNSWRCASRAWTRRIART
jgi:hypothetical protein